MIRRKTKTIMKKVITLSEKPIRVLVGYKPYKTQYSRMLLHAKGWKKVSVLQHAWSMYSGSVLVARHPLYLKLETTRRCNCNCIECVRRTLGDKDAVMDFETFKLIIDHVSPVVEIMPYGFGEPLLDPDFFQKMKYTNKKGMRLALVSNFTLMDQEMSNKVLDLRPAAVRVSIDGVGKRFEEIRRGAKYDEVVRNITIFRNAIRERKQRVDFQLNATIWRKNIDQIIPLTLLAKDLGLPICFTNISTACMDYECVPEQSISDDQTLLEETKALMEQALMLYDKISYNIEQPETRTCQRQWDSIFVDVNGNVYTCTNNIEEEDILGNVIHQHILEIFNGERYQRMRARSVLGYNKISCPTCMAYGPLPRKPKETEDELFGIAQIAKMESKLQNPGKGIAKN